MKIVFRFAMICVVSMLLAVTAAGVEAQGGQQAGSVYVVNTLDDTDDGFCGPEHCSLREAINAANAHPNNNAPDSIRFDEALAQGPLVLQPQTALPIIYDAVQLIGTVGGSHIELDGSLVDGDGLFFLTDNSTLRGFTIHSFSRNGVALIGDGNVVEGCRIGSDGSVDLGNGSTGISVSGSNNHIGGSSLSAGNLIAGNDVVGIAVSNGDGNVIGGNFIGVDASGELAIPNGSGVQIWQSTNTLVGSGSGSARNLISGNAGTGIFVYGGSGNVIKGNIIGLDAGASQVLPNGDGVVLQGGSNGNLVVANTVSGNIGSGITINPNSQQNQLAENFIGTTTAGLQAGNQRGVWVNSASQNTIGPGNTIAYNQTAGIQVNSSLQTGIFRNSVFGNGTGIDFPNSPVPPPVITQVTPVEILGTATISATVELFGGDGQGRYPLGNVPVDASGHFTFTDWQRGSQITATATGPDGTTSSFSTPVARLAPCPDPYEDNDNWTQAPLLKAGDSLQGAICSPGDVDFFKLSTADMAFGSKVRFRLHGADANLDLVLFRPSVIANDLPFRDTPPTERPANDVDVESLPLQNIPLQNIPLQNIPLQNIPLQNIPLQNIPLQNIPLQNISAPDTPVQNVPIVDYSVRAGTLAEEVDDRLLVQAEAYYLLVIGHNGEYGRQPYTLEVEVTPPSPSEPCTFSPPFGAGAVSGSDYSSWEDDAIQTLIVLPQKRLAAMYGEDALAPLLAALHAYADMPEVKGKILAVDADTLVSQAYADWNLHFCDPDKANVVSGKIKEQIFYQAMQQPNLQNIVLIGSDTALPFRRLADPVETANERSYAAQALVKQDTALFAALLLGYMFSDDFYADFFASEYEGVPLYVPDYNLGRVIENPTEITNQLTAFVASGGASTAEKAGVFGYDFLKDSSQIIADSFTRQGLQPTSEVNDTWDAGILRARFLQDSYDVLSLNAHFTHFLMAPAAAALDARGGLIRASEISTATVNIQGSVNLSVGCHSGLNVCDECSSQYGRTLGADLDFAQAFARQRAVWVGNTGYGYGDDAAATLSEELAASFVRHLGSQAGMPVGKALRLAKQEYALTNMGAYGPYDMKVLNEVTLYGLPNVRVSVPNPVATGTPDAGALGPLLDEASGLKSRVVTFTPQLAAVTTPRGSYFQAEDGVQALLYAPLQPRSQIDIALDADQYPGYVAHGVVFLGGSFQDHPDFDPVITMPVTDTQRYEPQIIDTSWQPVDLSLLNHFRTNEGLQEWLTVTPGQFRPQRVDNASAEDRRVLGVERTYSELQFQAYYSDSNDYIAPLIQQVTLERQGNDLQFQIRISDNGPIWRTLVACTGDNGQWQMLDLTNNDIKPAIWQGTLVQAGSDASCVVQAVDQAGNVALSGGGNELSAPLMSPQSYWPAVFAP